MVSISVSLEAAEISFDCLETGSTKKVLMKKLITYWNV